MDYIDDLDSPLLRLSPHDNFTLRDAVAGVHCFGGIGSGKSSGLAKTLAGAYLRAGMGGIVMTAKPDEIGLWTDYARRNGRASSLVFFDETKGFNFLAHLMAQHGVAGVGSVIECLMAVLEASDHATGNAGKEGDAFWGQSSRMLLQYSLPLIFSAIGSISVSSVLSFVNSAATRAEQYVDPTFMASSFAAKTLRKAVDDPAVRLPEEELKTLLTYWFTSFPATPDRTRGNVVVSLTAKLDRFLHGRLRDCFCGKTDVVPEMTFGGAIIILAMPALTWQADGVVAQMLFKHALQKVVESRNSLSADQRHRPVFIFADEAHYFLSTYDDTFLSTSRSSRACMVYLSQNLPSYYARVGKDKTDAVDGLIGKFGGAQVFFSNSCNRTNQLASQLLGKGVKWRANESSSKGSNRSRGMNEGWGENEGASSGDGSSWAGGPGPGSWNRSANSNSSSGSSENFGMNLGRGVNESRSVGGSEAWDLIKEPTAFATELKTGGPANDNKVSAIWLKAGGSFVDGFTPNALRVVFRQ